MPIAGSSTQPASAATTATFFNIALGVVNTEQNQVLPTNTKEFIIKSRANSVLKLAYTTGESGTKFITIPKGGVYTDSNLYTTLTIYFQSPQTSDTVEIVAFS